ncbi:hypothetical protein [Methylotuvimicrobium sp. KM2]|uniref:hypothetical protein n=1 Tax=Methylotuvimicrobium sp. KM2 TaxID=3133976 RepID=UPI003100F6C7
MNITDATPQRRKLGIELFVDGTESLVYEGVVFHRHEGHLVVASYSDFIHSENSSLREAIEKIERSKAVLAAFSAVSASLPHKYEFCYDYGMGTVKLAELQGSEVVWCAK